MRSPSACSVDTSLDASICLRRSCELSVGSLGVRFWIRRGDFPIVPAVKLSDSSLTGLEDAILGTHIFKELNKDLKFIAHDIEQYCITSLPLTFL